MVSNVSYVQRRARVTEATGNRAKIQLGKEAVRCALNGQWEQAVAANREILELCPTDCEASNRLAKALMELGRYAEARHTLEQLQLRSPSNVIARKNLARLDQLQSESGGARSQSPVAGKSPGIFIAESGKSCTTTLCRQAGPSDTAPVSAGDVVALDARNDGITINTLDGQYLGTLERRLGRRVSRLMTGGNRYEAAVVGVRAGRIGSHFARDGSGPGASPRGLIPGAGERNQPVRAHGGEQRIHAAGRRRHGICSS